MKKFKMVTSWLLTVALLLSMCVTVAFAADSATLVTTIPENGKLSQGNTFTLSVTVPVVTGAFDNATVDLKFDKTILEVIALNMPATIGGKDTTTTEVDEANSAGAFGVTWAGSSGITMTEPLVIKATFKVLEAASVGLKSDLITVETYEFELDGAELSLPDFNTRTVSLTITAPHGHQWSTNWTSDGTHHWHECTAEGCDVTDNAQKDGYAAHSGGNATCTTKAVCSVCNQSYGDYAAHKFTKEVENDTYYVAGTGADCQHAKEYYYACADCNAVGTNKWTSTTKGPHSFDTTAWGYKGSDGHAHKCTVSGCTEHETVVAHTPGAAATETTPQTCTGCGYVITPALGHVHTSHLTSVAAQAPTCTAPGNDAYWTCTCGKLFSDAAATTETTLAAVTKAALGHTPGDWQFDNDNHWKVCATCQAELDKASHANFDKWLPGVDGHYHECSVCHERSEVTPHTDFEWAYDNTQHWRICKECGYEEAESRENHTFEGDSKNCSQQCGYTKSSNITIITPAQPGDSKPAEGNPSTGAASSPVGYVVIGLAAVGALCFGAKKLTKKHED